MFQSQPSLTPLESVYSRRCSVGIEIRVPNPRSMAHHHIVIWLKEPLCKIPGQAPWELLPFGPLTNLLSIGRVPETVVELVIEPRTHEENEMSQQVATEEENHPLFNAVELA